mmetsp:Transcript_19599/g.54488  ORF Transcript_19599/g.54488 Transcript_19599/m.54488 type:complete len:309 (-) Transcript_19599:790-1716(-)
MANNEAMGTAGEAAISEESAVVSESGPHDGAGGSQHFGHAWAALGPLVANDDDSPLEAWGVLGERVQHFLLAVKAPGHSLKLEPLLAGDLGNRALGSEVAIEDLQMAVWLDGGFDGHDDFLAFAETRASSKVLSHRLSGDSHAGAVNEALLQQVLEHSGRATDLVEVLHHVLARGLEVRDEGYAVRHLLEVVDGERHAAGLGHGKQVQDGIGGTARGHDHHHRVLKGGARHDVPRLDVLLHEVEKCSACHAAFIALQWVLRRDGRGVGQRHAHGLDGGCHCVGGVHASAGSSAGAGVADNVEPLVLVD